MKSDIEIAQEAELVHIKEVAEKLGINEDELEFYGKYKAKISDELWESVKDREDGKLVLGLRAGGGSRSGKRAVVVPWRGRDVLGHSGGAAGRWRGGVPRHPQKGQQEVLLDGKDDGSRRNVHGAVVRAEPD